jgi:tol-pal system-associated acyl-CoA thioesterase
MEARVYYEDTDSGGVVYHANYLHFMERGRTEFFRERGIDVAENHGRGILFVVVHVDMSFLAPARLDDLLDVETRVLEIGHASFTFSQRITRRVDEKRITEARVKLACTREGKPLRLSEPVRDVLEESRRAAGA